MAWLPLSIAGKLGALVARRVGRLCLGRLCPPWRCGNELVVLPPFGGHRVPTLLQEFKGHR